MLYDKVTIFVSILRHNSSKFSRIVYNACNFLGFKHIVCNIGVVFIDVVVVQKMKENYSFISISEECNSLANRRTMI